MNCPFGYSDCENCDFRNEEKNECGFSEIKEEEEDV